MHRGERLNKTLREELGILITRELELSTLLTLTSVEVDEDFRVAKVKFSTLPSHKAPEILKILQKKGGWLRSLLDKKIRIKSIPRFVLEIDYGLEKAAEIEKELLKK